MPSAASATPSSSRAASTRRPTASGPSVTRDKLRDILGQSPEVQIYQEYVQAVGLGYEVTIARPAGVPGLRRLDHARVRHGGEVSRAHRGGAVAGVVGELLMTARRARAALRRVAGVVDRRRVRPGARRHGVGPEPRVREAPASARTGTEAASDLPARSAFAIVRVPRFGADYARPLVEGTSADGARRGTGPLRRDGRARRGRQLRHRRAPHDLRQAARRRSTGCAPATGSSSRPPPDGPCMPCRATRSSARPSPRSSPPCPATVRPHRRRAVLTLTACHPKFSAKQRWIVHADLVETRTRAQGAPSDRGRRSRPRSCGDRRSLMYAALWRALPGPVARQGSAAWLCSWPSSWCASSGSSPSSPRGCPTTRPRSARTPARTPLCPMFSLREDLRER